MYRISLLVIVLILYGTLYPFHFHSIQLTSSPLWVLFHSWPPIDRFVIVDVALNVMIFVPVGVFGFLALREHLPTTFAVIVIVVCAFTLSSGIELIQLYDSTRDCTTSDVMSNVTGALIGSAVGYFYQGWLELFVSRAETAAFLHPSSAVLLFYIWLAYQCFPLFPELGRTRVTEKFHDLVSAMPASPLEIFTCFVEWLVVAALIESILGAIRTRRLLPSAVLILPARILLVGRTVTWSELVGAALACIFYYFAREFRRRIVITCGLILLLIVLRGLAPYRWSGAPNPFSWLPFSGFLESDREFGVLTFLQKCFWYGSGIWLLRAAGWRFARATVMIALLLGGIELIQIHLPGRVAEITDPLLAVILAATLALLETRRGSAWSTKPIEP